jgi:hypothetical protein
MNDDRRALGATFQPAPGVLVLTASRLREFESCRRRYFLTNVLKLRTEGNPDAALDLSGELPRGGSDFGNVSAATVGSYVHEELRLRHEQPSVHQQSTSICSDQPPLAAVHSAVQRHLTLCPGQDGAIYLGGEMDLRWFIARKLVLVNGRVDALWQPDDGTIAVRDYKTGSPLSDLSDDIGALIYALLAAANYPGKRLRVSYEYLGSEPASSGDRVVSLDVTKQHLNFARHRLDQAVEHIRKEQQFLPTPQPHSCRWCPYATNCDAAPKEPTT